MGEDQELSLGCAVREALETSKGRCLPSMNLEFRGGVWAEIYTQGRRLVGQ